MTSLPSLSGASVQQFQTLLTGVLGFSGVIITLFVNASLARCQAARFLRNEQESICAALNAELTIRRNSIQKSIADFRKIKNQVGEVIIPIIPRFAVYDALLPRIGVLSSRKVQVIMNAYLTDETLLKSLILLGKRDSDHVSVNAKQLDKVTLLYESVLPEFERAIYETAPPSPMWKRMWSAAVRCR